MWSLKTGGLSQEWSVYQDRFTVFSKIVNLRIDLKSGKKMPTREITFAFRLHNFQGTRQILGSVWVGGGIQSIRAIYGFT